MRIALIILIAITTSGCISADYKSGSYWVLDENSPTFNKTTPEQCTSNKIKTNGATASSSQIIAPYFIPLFHLSGMPDKEIIITIENQTCPELSVSAESKDNPAYTAHSLNSEHCRISIAQPKQAERIIIKTLSSKSDCEGYTMTLVKKNFFCVRQTAFGGSPSCKKNL